MEDQSSQAITIDINPFEICSFCVRMVPIVILEAYMLFMFIKELLKSPRVYYDKLDKTIFLFSALSFAVDLVSILFFGQALSQLSYILKLVWIFPLFLVFLRFLLQQFQCAKCFVLAIIALLFYLIMSIIFLNTVQIKYPLLILYSVIGMIGVYQIVSISQILKNEKFRKKQLKLSMQTQRKNQNEIELLQKKDYQFKILPNQFKYHIYLRKSFCFTITCSLMLSYAILWDLEGSRSLIGQFLVVAIVEMLTPGTYFFFACANQWVVKRINSIQGKQFQNSLISVDDEH